MRFESRKIVVARGLTACVLLLASAAPHARAMGAAPQIDFEQTGKVIDDETKEPIEGAFVMAVYLEVRSGLAATAIECVKTKGMYTGKDGKFHFPVEKLDGTSPSNAIAIKPGYVFVRMDFPKGNAWRKQDWNTYSNWNIYLAKQKPGVLDDNFSGTVERCSNARSRADAEAAIEFLKIRLVEITRLGGPLVGQITEATNSTIKYLQSKPDRSEADK